MTRFENPKTRKFGNHIYHIDSQGLTKNDAIRRKDQIKRVNGSARVIEDERLGRYDIVNHDAFYCVYSRKNK